MAKGSLYDEGKSKERYNINRYINQDLKEKTGWVGSSGNFFRVGWVRRTTESKNEEYFRLIFGIFIRIAHQESTITTYTQKGTQTRPPTHAKTYTDKSKKTQTHTHTQTNINTHIHTHSHRLNHPHTLRDTNTLTHYPYTHTHTHSHTQTHIHKHKSARGVNIP